MRAILLLVSLSIFTAASLSLRAEESPITSPPVSEDQSPAAVDAAAQHGAASAANDIKAGIFRILYAGAPLPPDWPSHDEQTGYRIQVVGGCIGDAVFDAEVEAYNRAMREWHSRHK